jgi:acyl carrier protein
VTEAEATAAIVQALGVIAPEADPAGLDPERPLQDQVDLDSMDMLALVEEVGRLTGVEIPDADTTQLATLADGARYLAGRAG